MNLFRQLSLAALVIGLATVSVAQAQEKKLKREQLPPAVEKTVATESQGATINGFATEVERGKRLYEVELTVSGRSKDISMDKNGKVVEVEEEVTMDSLPATVQDGLRKAAGPGTIGKIESLTKSGKLVAYEAQVKTGTKRSGIQVGPNGEKLARPE
jgi:Putative beta-lactamase-inhibitor-like, PepSY-like